MAELAQNLERKDNDGPFEVVPIPENLMPIMFANSEGAIDILKQVYERTGAKVKIPKYPDPKTGNWNLEVTGSRKQIALALQEIAAFLSENSNKGSLMMNPLYYAEMIGWDNYQNFAYPGELPPGHSQAQGQGVQSH